MLNFSFSYALMYTWSIKLMCSNRGINITEHSIAISRNETHDNARLQVVLQAASPYCFIHAPIKTRSRIAYQLHFLSALFHTCFGVFPSRLEAKKRAAKHSGIVECYLMLLCCSDKRSDPI